MGISKKFRDNDSTWKSFESHAMNEGLSALRIKKLRTMYNLVVKRINLESAGRKELEQFIDDLNRDKYKNQFGKPFAGNTKQDTKKFLKQFFKWFKGNNEYYPPEIAWVKTRIPKHEKPIPKPIIEIKDAQRIGARFRKWDYRLLTLILFDSGFRIQEMMSCKKENLTWDEFDNSQKCFWLKCNKSKTFLRKIPIPLFTDDIKAFMAGSVYQSRTNDMPLFDIDYFSYLKLLKRYSKELTGKSLTPHCLRHSSATYYAKEYAGNVPLLAQRYGWSFDAQELKVYVRESGAYNKQGAKISYSNEVGRLKEQLEEQEQKAAKLEKQMSLMAKKFEEVNRFMDRVAEEDPNFLFELAKRARTG